MISVYQLKSRFQNILRPLVHALQRRGVSANQVTMLACLISVMVGLILCVAALQGALVWFYLLPIWFFVRMALNAMDGMLAREHHQQSPLGGYLNELTDVAADAALYLPFAWVAPFSPGGIGVLVWLAALTEFSGVLGAIHGHGRRYDGPMGKSDRAVSFGVLALWVAYAGGLPSAAAWIWYGMMLAALIWTVYRRMSAGLQPAD